MMRLLALLLLCGVAAARQADTQQQRHDLHAAQGQELEALAVVS